MLGELGLKWLELFQTGMPVAAFSATIGSRQLLNDVHEQRILWDLNLPWAVENARRLPFGALMNVYCEREWDTPLVDFRKRLGITRAPKINILEQPTGAWVM